MVGSVPSAVSSAFVKPSPSQSAPPSEGSSGSEPSAETPTEPAIKTRSSAIIMLVFFVFCIFFSLPKFSSENPPFSLSVESSRSSLRESIPPGVTDAFLEPTRYTLHDHTKRSTALHYWFCGILYYFACSSSFTHPISRAFIGNPPFPLKSQPLCGYIKSSRV